MARQVEIRGQHRVHGAVGWVVMGWVYGDGVMVGASDTLTQATFEAEFDSIQFTFRGIADMFYPDAVYTLHCRMGNITVAYGDSYPEALGKLFSSWQPKSESGWGSQAGPALPAGPSPELVSPPSHDSYEG